MVALLLRILYVVKRHLKSVRGIILRNKEKGKRKNNNEIKKESKLAR